MVKEPTGVVLDSLMPTNERIFLDLGQNVNDIQLKDQFAAGHDFSPKVRKPYTITKQRERWTEEEHKKFLEALKLYGRAWRRIEEHVGNKTAVQIRSHAQKFFSKVVRESNLGDSGSVKPIEIPPPRPKRKPMHPYPRKLVSPVKTGTLIPEIPERSKGQESQSPTSVLSAAGSGSDQSVGADSCMPNSSPSVSSTLAFGSDAPKLLPADLSSQSDREDENSSTEEEIPLELDFLPGQSCFVKKGPNETATQILKLFGKTLLVMESSQSCSTQGTCKTEPFDERTNTSEDAWCALSDTGDTGSGAHSPWLTLHTDVSNSMLEVHSPTPIRAQLSYPKREKLDNDEQKEGSSTGSNTDSDGGKFYMECFSPSLDWKGKKGTSFSSYKFNKRGFVPYKRCLTKQESTVSSTESAEEREKQRIRLC